MASTYITTRNLKLRVDNNLTANAKSNLEKIDLLGATFLTDSANTLRIRSSSDISIEPESPDLGGSALGGNLSVGNPSQFLSTIQLNTSLLQVTSGISTLDNSVSPPSAAKYLTLQYRSSLLDSTAGRTLYLDTVGADRTLTLGGSYTQAGGDLSLTLTTDSALTLPVTGTLATLAGLETLTNKTIDAQANTLFGITNSSISASAGILYSKLALSGSIVDSDISSAAAIQYAKLNLAGDLKTSDMSTSLALPYSYLDLYHSITLNDLVPGIQIPGSAIVPIFLSPVTAPNLVIQGITYNTTLSVPIDLDTQTQDLQFYLPNDYGSTGQVLATDGTGSMSWVDKSTGGTSITGYATDWIVSDGPVKTITHGLATTDINVVIRDVDAGLQIYIDEILTIDLNTVRVTSTEAPAGTWRIIVQGQ